VVGIVAVSHSRALAAAAVDLARQMAGDTVRIEVAAGLDDGTLGTDAAAVAEAVVGADDGDGVVVLTDLGSAVLSAQLALDLLDEITDDPTLRRRVTLSAGPFVEGLVIAAVAASTGVDLDDVAAQAARALAAKDAQLEG
jgi:phosphocarrier protein FPr